MVFAFFHICYSNECNLSRSGLLFNNQIDKNLRQTYPLFSARDSFSSILMHSINVRFFFSLIRWAEICDKDQLLGKQERDSTNS